MPCQTKMGIEVKPNMDKKNNTKMIPCNQEHKIGQIEAKLETLNGIVPKLHDTVIRLDETVKILSDNSRDMTTAINGLLKFQAETLGEIKATQRMRTSQRWLIGLLIASGLTIGGFLIELWT